MKTLPLSLVLILFLGSLNATSLSKSLLKHSVSIKVNDIRNPRSLTNTNIIKTAKKYLGVRYKYGASVNTTKKFDCSSFTKHIYKTLGKKIPRTSRAQATIGKRISKKNLRVGDLVFFGGKIIGHVGIYIGNDKFIHASSAAKRVTITSLSKTYYKSRYKGARRV